MLSGHLYICSIVGDGMIRNNQLTRLWSLTFCGGREENYGTMKDGVCPIQCVNWALTKIYLVSLVTSQLAQADPFLNVRSGIAWASLLFARLLTLIVILTLKQCIAVL